MKKYTNIAIVASFFGLWMDSYFSKNLQIMSGFFLIFTFGILHGANDLLIINKFNVKKPSDSQLKIFGYYVIVVLTGLLLFYIIPQLALLLFIIVSAYHFGEQQWQNLEVHFPKWLVIVFQFFYGFSILLLLFHFHTIKVQNIILNIVNATIPIPYFTLLLEISGITFLCLSAYFYWKSNKIRNKLLLEFFHLLVFAIIFKSSSLIWGFAIYFVIWHSIPSIIDQIKFMNGSFSKEYFIAYCRSAGIYWLISILGIALIYFTLKEEKLFNALFFSFLAAITFPHTVVINRMFQGNKKQKN
ncbi:Brp/Blh family beta-carotene 15,15'-dioxygenase [Flavobacterium sp.]|uniref:Brp/Blh family beta-carotene 15,15'-dioxygenase n=1 Tax=Flavobacterium sp. TaxID=239 RepID=UPI00286E8CE0|nr:Brp/Blh family beta-carotene 15,15'-dioxygenase [Flavobacterium sp.]